MGNKVFDTLQSGIDSRGWLSPNPFHSGRGWLRAAAGFVKRVQVIRPPDPIQIPREPEIYNILLRGLQLSCVTRCWESRKV